MDAVDIQTTAKNKSGAVVRRDRDRGFGVGNPGYHAIERRLDQPSITHEDRSPLSSIDLRLPV